MMSMQFRVIRCAQLLLNELAELDILKTKSNFPLVKILEIFILLIEGRNTEFLSPEGRVAKTCIIIDTVVQHIFDGLLVEGSGAECPDLVFVTSVVDSRRSVWRRVRVQ